MKALPFVFGIHNHQPLGNFDHVVSRLTETCYLPFLKGIKGARHFRLAIHVSGILLKWWEEKAPQVIETLGELAAEGQVEFVCGGFFEPVLAAISRDDRKEQILRHKDYIRRRFGQTPTGLWLTERVWESQIIEDLADLGIEYVVVDDRHFIVSGFSKDQLFGYYLTESEGKRLAIFPIDETLRYAIPFWPVKNLENYLRDIRFRGGRMFIYFDDGEKFGAWPGTAEWVYQKGWLKNFLEASARWVDEDLVHFLTYQEALKKIPPQGICYLPTASYMEMEEWTLPTSRIYELEELFKRLGDDKERFKGLIRGGHWKNFLVKYPESNHLHKRMLMVSQLTRQPGHWEEGARLSLLAAQCNDAYWHGIFGGLYLPHLRQAVWASLAEAEGTVRRQERAFKIEVSDINFDGQPEVFVHSKEAALVFLPHYGGQLREWTIFSARTNYINTLTRREEAYHRALKEKLLHGTPSPEGAAEGVFSIHHLPRDLEPDLLASLAYDWYERNSFIDHFFDPFRDLEAFRRCDFGEWGDFANQPFGFRREKNELIFSREGGLYPPGLPRHPLKLTKRFRLSQGGREIEVHYHLENLSKERISCRFGVEFNLFPAALAYGQGRLLAGGQQHPLNEAWAAEGVGEVLFEDQAVGARLRLVFPSASLWFFPVETVSQSESGYEKTIQALALMPHFLLELDSGEGLELVIKAAVR
ncbi:DUF1926 domain-containing protein [Thermosulfuriphilus ammonigenes]|uniref:DUF1926 domain-containing protein n=1 Tax=Thermosulfuriphilus ammonigenes TaxID=1936021 RepID=A0A6G7PWT7_9BACT|nr:alpha-amylase/4-alpha-glucanotransferase domain-containing protein [Thermosulfuriphilus ammonigenes]MBA2847818.1 alpha-amylase/alpha-mannosidase (GH57 family) [Thermosulfuriphilus ammonigenes]QIJ71981.1 DUF1926 domain-containing protein [Thermosulfuriphilus ammonigenes]